MSAIKVTIIITNYNGLKLASPNLSDCLSAISYQDFKDYEVILVDNGSEDASVDYVKSNYPQLAVVQLAKNYGFAAANNIGLRFASGDYIVLLNNDAVPLPGWLKSLVAAADQQPDYKILASIQLPDQGERKTRDLNVYGGVCVHDPKTATALLSSLFASGAACLIRRDWVDKLGYLFDETFGTFGEDLDLSIRTILAGGQIGYAASSKVIHTSGSTWRLYRMNSSYTASRNETLAYFKALGTRSYVKFIVARAVYIALRTLFKASELRKNVCMLAGLWEGLLRLPLYMRERTRFSKIKVRPDQYLLARLKFRPESLPDRIMWRFVASQR